MSDICYKELRNILEDANYRMKPSEYKDLEIAHLKLFTTIEPQSIYYKEHPFLNSFIRIVCGAHGPYFEFSLDQCVLPLEIKSGQEWRLNYSNVKYIWLNPKSFPEVKIYYQKKSVKYADYKPGFYYVDFYIDK